MRNYNTQQRQILLDFFNNHVDECLSTAEIIEGLSEHNISESAVYRNLVSLETEGKLHRTGKAGDRKTYYQYIGEGCRGQIHISCIKCGKTSHVSSGISKELAHDLKKEDDFEISKGETIIYGVCKDCRK